MGHDERLKYTAEKEMDIWQEKCVPLKGGGSSGGAVTVQVSCGVQLAANHKKPELIRVWNKNSKWVEIMRKSSSPLMK